MSVEGFYINGDLITVFQNNINYVKGQFYILCIIFLIN